jgi:hypothetical protein
MGNSIDKMMQKILSHNLSVPNSQCSFSQFSVLNYQFSILNSHFLNSHFLSSHFLSSHFLSAHFLSTQCFFNRINLIREG